MLEMNEQDQAETMSSQLELVLTEETKSQNRQLYEQMLLIRRFEERLFDEFSKGHVFGTTHAYIGQEANAVGIFDIFNSEDIVFSNHRCHGHFIAYGGDMGKLAAELMGKATGLCGGRGGSQHIYWRNFYSNGIQGGIVPCATGMALAEKEKQSGQIVMVFLGDGTLGEGVVYESLNLASLWRLPILFVVENNRYAQTTPISLALAGSISARFKAFGIECKELESTDVLEIRANAAEAVDRVRQELQPGGLVLHTYRLCAHSKGDDTRDPKEIERWRLIDPLIIHGQRLSEFERDSADAVCKELVNQAFVAAYEDPFPTSNNLTSPLGNLP